MIPDLINRLRAHARRYNPRTPERVLFLGAAERIEELQKELDGAAETEVDEVTGEVVITPEMVEKAMGSRLLPWQRRKLRR